MAEARANHEAILLEDGRVLIAGGLDDGGPLDGAELYDPSSGDFEEAGHMTSPRLEGSATLLSDGTVLLAGGADGANQGIITSSTATADLFDPATGKFSEAGRMGSSRFGHAAVRLGNGKVLIAGGLKQSSAVTISLSTAELFDPATGKFSPTGSMSSPRADFTATLLSDGRVLVTGGFNATKTSFSTLDSAEIYDPATGVFTQAGSLNAPRSGHTATLLNDGRVLIANGQGDAGHLYSCELFDPKTGSFELTGESPSDPVGHAAILLPDGRVLLAGGFTSGVGDVVVQLRSTALYEAGEFVQGPLMLAPRANFTATLLQDGRVLVAGGWSEGGEYIASAELLLP